MIYTIKFSCGHDEKVSLKGSKKEKEAEAERIHKEELCHECRGKQI